MSTVEQDVESGSRGTEAANRAEAAIYQLASEVCNLNVLIARHCRVSQYLQAC